TNTADTIMSLRDKGAPQTAAVLALCGPIRISKLAAVRDCLLPKREHPFSGETISPTSAAGTRTVPAARPLPPSIARSNASPARRRLAYTQATAADPPRSGFRFAQSLP